MIMHYLSRKRRSPAEISRCMGCGSPAVVRLSVASRLSAPTVTLWCARHQPSERALAVLSANVPSADWALTGLPPYLVAV